MGVECLKLQIKITTYYLIYNDFFSLYNKIVHQHNILV